MVLVLGGSCCIVTLCPILRRNSTDKRTILERSAGLDLIAQFGQSPPLPVMRIHRFAMNVLPKGPRFASESRDADTHSGHFRGSDLHASHYNTWFKKLWPIYFNRFVFVTLSSPT